MNKDIQLQVDEVFLDCDTNQPLYSVRYTVFFPYKDNDNYLCFREEASELQASSIQGLYENMGNVVVRHMLLADKVTDAWENPPDEYRVEFSDIYIEVERYNENRMKNSEVYRNIGAAKDKARLERAAEKVREEERSRQYLAKQLESREKEEYERLRKKFNGT